MPIKTRVLVVDDSASVRQTLSAILNADPEIEVIATASDPFVAAKRIAKERPDVITLDVEMPHMDGITFLRKLMQQQPIPVVMCSSFTEAGSATLMQALEAGAVDIIDRPKVDTTQYLRDASIHICDVVKAAARAKLNALPSLRTGVSRKAPTKKLTADAVLPPPGTRRRARTPSTDFLVCIGASTGGTESLLAVLQELSLDSPGILIVQHMPEKFTMAFANRLNSLCQVDVREAADGDTVLPGHVLIAPGNQHMLLQRSGARYYVSVRDGPLVSRHRPSVDVLFRSAARCAGPNALGILMTGMGDDGARGLLEMRQEGALTIAQDEATSIVFGMPREAIALGAAGKVVALERLATEIVEANHLQRRTVRRKPWGSSARLHRQ